jgi:hypothetical protein
MFVKHGEGQIINVIEDKKLDEKSKKQAEKLAQNTLEQEEPLQTEEKPCS